MWIPPHIERYRKSAERQQTWSLEEPPLKTGPVESELEQNLSIFMNHFVTIDVVCLNVMFVWHCHFINY